MLIREIQRTSLEAEPGTGEVDVRFADEVPDPQIAPEPHIVNPGTPQNPGSPDPGPPSRTIPAPDRDDPEASS
ncbi:MAG: hypothetical protein JWQ32_3383 [Marmoricola sp.]|nr:hypothetical protein [Marmoricola sp.]